MVFSKADVPYVSADTFYSLSDDVVTFVDKSHLVDSTTLTKHVLIYKKGTRLYSYHFPRFIHLPFSTFYTVTISLTYDIRYSSSAFP